MGGCIVRGLTKADLGEEPNQSRAAKQICKELYGEREIFRLEHEKPIQPNTSSVPYQQKKSIQEHAGLNPTPIGGEKDEDTQKRRRTKEKAGVRG
uniref:Uncharacterized protein n=1 Tax=Arundo donax TaxID=35708 RepID=A0A0A9DHF6_ARUDO